jgi:hypothetical protein
MGAMKLTPIAATEMLLNLTPLAPFTMVEARMALYRLHILKQPTVPKGVRSAIWKNVSDPLLNMRLDYTIPVYRHLQCHKKTRIIGETNIQCSLMMLWYLWHRTK